MGVGGITAPAGAALAALAVAAIGARLRGEPFQPAAPDHPELLVPGASFVTLERGGALRGCVGALDPARPLYLDVVRNAGRAMADPRLPALAPAEWPELDVTVSVLSAPEPVPGGADALAGALRPGVDGLILTDGSRRATFLPAVWHKVADPERFVAALLAKGGWTPGERGGLTALRYTATEFTAAGPRPALTEDPGAVSPGDAA